MPCLAGGLHIRRSPEFYGGPFMTYRRRRSIVLFTTLAIAAIGVVSIKADPLCHRLVREYREKRVKNRVSKETAARWAEWNKTHPNFHPHPRPKYKVAPEEVVKQMQFACQVPVKPVEVTALIPPELPNFKFDPVAPPAMPPPELPTVVEISTAATPPPPFLPPYSPGVPPGLSPVPEPGSFVLLITGGVFVGSGIFFQRRRTLSIAGSGV